MKLSNDFVLRKVVDSAVLVPFGKKTVNFNGMLTLNKVGMFIAELLQNETTLDAAVDAVVEHFEVERETAVKDVEKFLQQLRENGALCE